MKSHVTLTFCFYIWVHHQPEYSDADKEHWPALSPEALHSPSQITSHQLLQQDQFAFSMQICKNIKEVGQLVPWHTKLLTM